MTFDPTTARPIKTKFDPSTAKPINQVSEKPSLFNKYLTSADQLAGKVATKGLEAVSSIFQVPGEAVRVAREGYPFRLPSIVKSLGVNVDNPYITTKQEPSDIAEEIARGETGLGNLMTGQGFEKAKEAVETKPSAMQTMVSGAMLPMPPVAESTKALKSLKAGEQGIDAAKMIAGKLQHSSIENLTNPYVNKVAHSPNLAVKTEELVDSAATSFKNAYNHIKDIQNKFYKNAGVTDDMPVNVENALSNMGTKLEEYSKTAIGTADEKAISEANKIVSDIAAKAKNGTLTFGQLKKMKSSLYAIGDSHVNELGRQTPIGGLFKDMGHELVEAQKSLPQIQKAGDKYKDLLEAEDLMEHASRLDRYTGEMNLAKKIKNRYTDIGNQDWKDTVAKAEEIFKKYPESKEYADFGDKIKAAHLALDVEKAKAVTPLGIGRIPIVKYLANATKIMNPQFQINMLARGIKNGAIDIAGLLGKVKESQLPIGGTTITRARALKNILNLEKPTKAIKGAAIPAASGIRAYLQSKGEGQ